MSTVRDLNNPSPLGWAVYIFYFKIPNARESGIFTFMEYGPNYWTVEKNARRQNNLKGYKTIAWAKVDIWTYFNSIFPVNFPVFVLKKVLKYVVFIVLGTMALAGLLISILMLSAI